MIGTDNHSEPIEGEDFIPSDIFEEPEGFRPPPPPPSFLDFEWETDSGAKKNLKLRLIGKHSLWAHKLWNAGKSMALYLDKHRVLYEGKNVLELGAGASLPSFMCALNSAKKVVSTDYPDPDLIDNIKFNAKANIPELVERGQFVTEGYIWGQEYENVVSHLGGEKFHLIILADLIFNHTEHRNLLKGCLQMLAPDGIIITTFTHHVVKWADRDLKFMEIAESEFNLKVEKILEEKWNCMFPDDEGDVDVRSTVHGYILRV